MIDHVRKETEIPSFISSHFLDNPASGRVMEKSGMKKEGILRQRIRNKGEYVDVALFAILRSDLENQPL